MVYLDVKTILKVMMIAMKKNVIIKIIITAIHIIMKSKIIQVLLNQFILVFVVMDVKVMII